MGNKPVPWKEILGVALFFAAGMQWARLYHHWQSEDLARIAFSGDARAGLAYYPLLVIALLPLILYVLIRGALRAVAFTTHGLAKTREPEAHTGTDVLYQVVAHLKGQTKELKESHQLEKERAERHEQLNEQIISSLESALLTIDRNGAVSTFNPAAERLFKQSAAAARNRPFTEVFARSPHLATLIEGSLNKDLSYRRQEFNITNQAGQIRYVGAAVTPIKQPDGPTTAVLCLITDLTEIVELQQQVKLKENLAALGEMSAGIAHEFKNALATIGGYAQLIARETSQGEVQECIQMIRSEADGLTQIVSSFLDFAKPSRLVLEEIFLGELVENGVRDLQTENNFAHVHWEVAGAFGFVRGDRVLLKQALQNILRNAAEAISPDAPERRVRIHGRLEYQESGKQSILEIEDTGAGAAPADLEKIFLPFFTTKPSGTGLGLAITQKTIVYHNGKITAAPRTPGPGMRFTLALPAL